MTDWTEDYQLLGEGIAKTPDISQEYGQIWESKDGSKYRIVRRDGRAVTCPTNTTKVVIDVIE